MKSLGAENYLSTEGVKVSINDLRKENHDEKIRDLIKYDDVISISNISFDEGFDKGVEFERNKENYDTYIISLFKKIDVCGPPRSIVGKNRSKICVCFCPGDSCKEVDRYIFAYFDWDSNEWVPCLGKEIVGCIYPTKYLELPEPNKMKKEFDVTGKTRSTNQFKELPDGVYSGKFGGHVGTVEYLGNIYNYTFPKGINNINIPKTITVVNGYGWVFLSDGPIYPPFIIQ